MYAQKRDTSCLYADTQLKVDEQRTLNNLRCLGSLCMILLHCGVCACGSVRVLSGLLVLFCYAHAVLRYTAVQLPQVDEARTWVITHRPLPVFCQVWR